MPFQFTLDQVLRVRESIERREELALQRAEMEVARVQRRIDQLTENLAGIARRRDEVLQQATNAYELQSMDAETKATIEARKTMIDALNIVQGQRDQQRKIYQAAHNGRRMLTDLEKQQRIEYELGEVKAQQKKIDDLFAARVQRQ